MVGTNSNSGRLSEDEYSESFFSTCPSPNKISIFLFLPHIFFIIGFTALQVLRGSGNHIWRVLRAGHSGVIECNFYFNNSTLMRSLS